MVGPAWDPNPQDAEAGGLPGLHSEVVTAYHTVRLCL